jgi:hypothetical protein
VQAHLQRRGSSLLVHAETKAPAVASGYGGEPAATPLAEQAAKWAYRGIVARAATTASAATAAVGPVALTRAWVEATFCARSIGYIDNARSPIPEINQPEMHAHGIMAAAVPTIAGRPMGTACCSGNGCAALWTPDELRRGQKPRPVLQSWDRSTRFAIFISPCRIKRF